MWNQSQKFDFIKIEYGHVAYQIKGNDAYTNIAANSLPIFPSRILLVVGSKVINSTFSEHGHVAYQVKGNDECSNMQSHIFFLTRTLDP